MNTLLTSRRAPNGLVRAQPSRARHFSAAPLLTVAAVLGYTALLQWSYLTVEGVLGYTAMNIKDIAPEYLIASFGSIAVLSLVLPLYVKKPSDVALWVLFLTWYVPCMLFTYHVGELKEQETLIFLLFLTAAFLMLIAICRGRPLELPRLEMHHTTFVLILALLTLALTVVVVALIPQTSSGGSLASFFALDDVYTRRLQARQIVAGRSFTGYGFATLSSCLAPMALAYGLVTRRHWFTLLGVGSLLCMFMLDGTKGYLFAPLLFVVVVMLAKRPRIPFGFACAVGLMATVALSLYLFATSGNVWLSVNIVRRVVVARGTTLGLYFELFRGRPMYMQDSSLFAFIGDRAFDKAFQIGEAYGSGIEANWNGSAWAAMFADFGVPGLFIATILTGLILRWYDGVALRAPFPIVAAMAGYIAHTWGDGAVTSSILTYGVLATLLLLNHYGTAPSGAADTVRAVTMRGGLRPRQIMRPQPSPRTESLS